MARGGAEDMNARRRSVPIDPRLFAVLVATVPVLTSCGDASLVDPAPAPLFNEGHTGGSNAAPVANAGEDLHAYAGMTVTFDGSLSTDLDGDSLTYEWYFSAADTFPDAIGRVVSRRYLTVGEFGVRLRVRDEFGGQAEDRAHVTISANTLPVAAMSVGTRSFQDGDSVVLGNEGVRMLFSAAGSVDPDSTPLTYSWNFGDRTRATEETVNKAFADNGFYRIRLIVRDASGGADTLSIVMRVRHSVPAGVFVAPDRVSEGRPYRLRVTNPFDLSPVDAAAGFLYAFDCGTGFAAYTRTATVLCPAIRDQGSVRIRIRIRDKDGAFRTFTKQVAIVNTRPAVVIHDAPDSITAGTAYVVRWSFTDPGTADSPWAWLTVLGTRNTRGTDVVQGNEHVSSQVFAVPGEYDIMIRVTDKDGAAHIVRRHLVVTP